MSSRLILIAHAETDATRRGAFPDGESLNQRGQRAARDQWSAMPKRDLALASPAPAARECSSAMGLQADIDPALGELDVGSWRGRALAEIGAATPDALAAWIGDPAFVGHGGESIEALVVRTRGWLEARREARGTTIAVSHAAVLRAALVAMLDAPASAFWVVDVGPLTMITLTSDTRRWALRDLRTP